MPTRTAFLTICSNNYLGQAQVFFESVRAHHPDVDLVLGLADRSHPGDLPLAGVEVIEAERLPIPEFESFAFAYDIMEFNTAIKPFLLLELLERGYERIVFFDPDIAIYRRLDDLFGLLDGGASFVLTPHFTTPPGLGAARREIHALQTGVYNLGFLALSNHPETEPTLRWWARQMRHGCVNEQAKGLFVDQKYMDLLPGLVDHAHVLRDAAFNVAYWNLPQRRLAPTPRGSWTVEGQPLAFFHFSGFDPDRPAELSHHAPGAPVSEALAALLGHYADRRRGARPHAPVRDYAYARFASGVPIPDMVRRMFRERHLTWSGDPFRTYDRYARLPSPRARVGSRGEIVTNLMHHHHGRTPALHVAYDLTQPVEVSVYARLFARTAAAEGVDPSLWRSAA